jgi:hypothetical protein
MPPREGQDKVPQPRREVQADAKPTAPRERMSRELSSAARQMHGPNSNEAEQRLLRCDDSFQRG